MATIITSRSATKKLAAKEQQAALDRFNMRKAWFLSEAHRQGPWRRMAAKCEGMYDCEQWDQDSAQRVRDRGQNPVVYNEIKPSVDWLIGTERRTRIDFQCIARNDSSPEAQDDARVKTKILKYLSDVNRSPFERSNAWEDAMKAGLGWLETGVRSDPDEEAVYTRSESWRNMLYDSFGTRLDTKDWRYIFRIRCLDVDVALAYFPEREEQIMKVRQRGDNIQMFRSWMAGAGLLDFSIFEGVSGQSYDYMVGSALDWYNPRERVMLLECWSSDPFTDQVQAGGSLYDRVRMRKRVAIMTEFDTLEEEWSPYRHNEYPFTPVWAYRNKRTGMPYSPVLPLIGPQEALNHRMSKALFEVSANQVIMEKSAVDAKVMSVDKIQDEIAAPDGVVILADGALAGGKFESRRGIDNAEAHMRLAEIDRTAIQSMAGVTGENRALETNATSGKAIMAKQDQGSLLTTQLFDNLLLTHQLVGEKELSLVEQYMPEAKVFSIAGDFGQMQYESINQPQPDGSKLNDITKRQAQFIIGEQPWRQSLGQAAFESMIQLLGQLAPVAPQVVTAMLDMVFEYADLPNKRALMDRIRSVTGQVAPGEKMTPEMQQQLQQKQQIAQAQFQAQMAQLQATIHKAQAEGSKLDASAIATRLEALYMAAQAAQVIMVNPAMTPVADALAAAAGFQDMGGDPQVLNPQLAQAAPQLPSPQGPIPSMHTAGQGAMAGIETPRLDGVNPAQPIHVGAPNG